MKFRWLAVTVAVAAFSAAPFTLAQVSDPDAGQPKAGDAQSTSEGRVRAFGTVEASIQLFLEDVAGAT